ncbi:hypothetical protein BC832DRAFT_346712 [Gaertneriomyces semiglobifer]|nr:hypothetical protein BC832DRAFT_346712 [Gaertneriomyces semiglobifer]
MSVSVYTRILLCCYDELCNVHVDCLQEDQEPRKRRIESKRSRGELRTRTRRVNAKFTLKIKGCRAKLKKAETQVCIMAHPEDLFALAPWLRSYHPGCMQSGSGSAVWTNITNMNLNMNNRPVGSRRHTTRSRSTRTDRIRIRIQMPRPRPNCANPTECACTATRTDPSKLLCALHPISIEMADIITSEKHALAHIHSFVFIIHTCQYCHSRAPRENKRTATYSQHASSTAITRSKQVNSPRNGPPSPTRRRRPTTVPPSVPVERRLEEIEGLPAPPRPTSEITKEKETVVDGVTTSLGGSGGVDLNEGRDNNDEVGYPSIPRSRTKAMEAFNQEEETTQQALTLPPPPYNPYIVLNGTDGSETFAEPSRVGRDIITGASAGAGAGQTTTKAGSSVTRWEDVGTLVAVGSSGVPFTPAPPPPSPHSNNNSNNNNSNNHNNSTLSNSTFPPVQYPTVPNPFSHLPPPTPTHYLIEHEPSLTPFPPTSKRHKLSTLLSSSSTPTFKRCTLSLTHTHLVMTHDHKVETYTLKHAQIAPPRTGYGDMHRWVVCVRLVSGKQVVVSFESEEVRERWKIALRCLLAS